MVNNKIKDEKQDTNDVTEVEHKVGIAVLDPDIQPTEEMIEKRWHEIKDGYAYPAIESFPNIRFGPITRLERAISDRLYEEKLGELRAEDKKMRAAGKPGLLDELDVGLQVREWARERGWNPATIDEKHRRYSRRIIAEAPFALTRTSVQMLTPDEVVNLSAESRLKYEAEEIERVQKYSEWVKEHTSDEERDIREKYYLLQLKNQELEKNCMQVLARVFSSICRMLMNAVDETTISETNKRGLAYFSPLSTVQKIVNSPEYRELVCIAVDEWEASDNPDRDMDFLYNKWKEWEDGRELDFLSR